MKLKTKGRNSNLWLALFLSGYSILTQNSPSIAQIIPDDTLGSEASVVNQVNETLQQIDGGALRGENLFHSFLEFSINEGNSVYFSNPADVINIFSRVTGNNISNILGTLGVSGNANLYLVNPNGILFGPSASIDIAGSFVANSGSAFIINGMEYSASNPQGVPLLTVTATVPVGLKLEGSDGIITNEAQLTAGNNLTLVGNQLDLQGQIVTQGDLTLQASDSIKIQNATINVRGNEGRSINANAKNISIQNSFVFAGIGSGLGFENAQAGDINFNVAENLTISGGSAIANQVYGKGNAGAVKITATEGIMIDGDNGFNGGIYNSIVGGGEGTTEGIVINTGSLSVINGGQILANVFGEGNAGAVKITATEGITIDGETNAPFNVGIFSTVFGVGRSGGIVIDTGFLSLTNGGQIVSGIFGKGDAGGLQIKASEGITVDGQTSNSSFNSGIFSSVFNNGVGTTGGMVIETTTLSLTNRGIINANLFGEGDTGAVQIKASEGITLDGETNDDVIGGIYSNVIGIGTSGGIFIDTTTLSLTNGGNIDASTFGKGNTGAIQIKATEGITLDGETTDGRYSSIFSAGGSNAVGDSKGIVIDTTTLSLTNGAEISTSIAGEGNAGMVQIKASKGIIIDGQTTTGGSSGIFSRVNSSEAVGNSGAIVIDTTTLSLTNGGEITSTTFGTGDAGVVQINASEEIIIDGETSTGFVSGIFSQVSSSAVGKSGGIVINTTNLSISNGGRITVNIFGKGEQGNINITNRNLNLNEGTISAETTSGDGGNINLTVQEFLTLRNNSKISTTAGNQQTGGNGGNINIFARYIFAIPEENNDITANAFTGKGGQIFIATEAIFGIEPRDELTFLSDITASSELGVDGIIEITRLNVDPLEGLTNLPETRAEVEVAQGCEVGGEGSVAFYDLGKGGLPAQPTDFLRSKPIPWIRLTTETQQQSWGLTDKTYSVFPATTPIQFKFSCQQF